MQPYNYQGYPYVSYQPQYANPMIPYQERLAQMQMQYNQPQYNQAANQSVGLSGEMVDGIDVVKAKNVDMSGNITFYPKSDLTEIYTKQLQMDGTSKIVTYKAVQPEESKQAEVPQGVDIQALNAMLGQLKTEIMQGIMADLSEIKSMIVPPEAQRGPRGGSR